jgi:chemotaxis protein CheD
VQVLIPDIRCVESAEINACTNTKYIMDDFTNQRGTEIEKVQSGDYFSGADRYYDQISEHTVVKIYSGHCYSTAKKREMLVTILGSCVAACIRDPFMQVGGMNHFLLPDASDKGDSPARYGAYAMEKLINDLIKMGARKNSLEVKIFGGGNVIKSSAMIGDKNVDFIRNYLKEEGLIICQEDLGGTSPRRVHYYPDTGIVMMRRLNRDEDYVNVVKEEKTYQKTITLDADKGTEGNLELF